jgi:hypothetical protein
MEADTLELRQRLTDIVFQTTTLADFIREIDSIDLKQFIPGTRNTYGNYMLDAAIHNVAKKIGEAEKVHYLLESGVDPNTTRVNRNGVLIFGAMHNALRLRNSVNQTVMSKVIIDLIRHGAVFQREELNTVQAIGFTEAQINELKKHVPEGRRWLQHLNNLSTPEGMRNAYWNAREPYVSLVEGLYTADAAYPAHVETPLGTDPILRYYANPEIVKAASQYMGPPGAQSRYYPTFRDTSPKSPKSPKSPASKNTRSKGGKRNKKTRKH